MNKDRRHKNWDFVTKTKLTFLEHASQSGICSICTKDGVCEIGKKAKEGRTLYPEPFGLQFGAEKRVPNIDDLQILPELFGDGVIFKEVDLSTKLGGFNVTVPICIAALGSTKVAFSNIEELSAGAAMAGIPFTIGENVYPTHGVDGLKKAIKPYLDNYSKKGGILVQANVHDMKAGTLEKGLSLGAHGIELKLGQGAKMGLGGEIVFESKEDAKRYRKLGYTIIERPDGTFERHGDPGNIDKTTLRKTLIKYSDKKVPIWIKVAAGRGIVELLEFLAELKKKDNVRLQAVTIDGHGGGTGMSPWLIMNETGVPSAWALRDLHPNKSKLGFDIILAGGYNDGIDVAKALMLGADGVAMGRAMLIAANTAKAQGVANFIAALKEELQMVCAVLRKKKLTDIKGLRQNLYPLSAEAEQMFGL
jgi:glutamate synthase domain-containing protein 2